MRLKYIITEANGFAMFSPESTHANVARGMEGKPVSAGFCIIDFEENKVRCYGESVTLKLKSRDEDSDIITKKIKDAY